MIAASVDLRMPERADLSYYQKILERDLEKIAKNTESNAKRSSAFQDESGALRDSIQLETRFEYTTSKGNVRFATKLPRNREADDVHYLVRAKSPHAHLIEFGHAMVTVTGHTVGYVAARPFLRPAFAQALRNRGLGGILA